MAADRHQCACCSHPASSPSVHQTLNEMDFERGIWSAAMDGDLERVSSLVQRGTDPNQRDSAGYTALVGVIVKMFVFSVLMHLNSYVCVFGLSTMRAAVGISLCAGSFSGKEPVCLPRRLAAPRRSIGRLTAATWMWSASCCSTEPTRRSATTTVHPLCIRLQNEVIRRCVSCSCSTVQCSAAR